MGVFILFDAFLMSVYIAFTLFIGAKINSTQQKHLIMLCKEKLKLLLQTQQLKVEKEESEHVESTIQVLETLVDIVEKQDAVFHILGVSLGEGTTKAIIGLTMSLTVAVVARLELDLAAIAD
jgi:hypothetical protein